MVDSTPTLLDFRQIFAQKTADFFNHVQQLHVTVGRRQFGTNLVEDARRVGGVAGNADDARPHFGQLLHLCG